MLSEVCSEDLEKEIIMMQQELYVKRSLLDDCRKKLTSEISEHTQTKSTVAKHLSENTELKVQLEISLAATKKLEEEYGKTRELLIKLQVQMDAYMHERVQLSDRCYTAENENIDLKRELAELKEELKHHLLFQDNYKIRLSKTEALMNETVKKQETLNREQKRLEVICKESLKCAEKLSEENNFQMKFVHEANMGHRKIEEELIRLMAVLRQQKTANVKETQKETNLPNYLQEWKHSREEMKRRQEELEGDNKRLQEELKFVMEQNEILVGRL